LKELSKFEAEVLETFVGRGYPDQGLLALGMMMGRRLLPTGPICGGGLVVFAGRDGFEAEDSNMILITGHVLLTPEHRERMIALGAGHSVRSRGEAGCLAHHCHVDVVPRQARDGSDYECLVFVEEWESVDAVRAHFAVPASRAFVAEMRRLSPEPPVMRIYAAEDITAKLMGSA